MSQEPSIGRPSQDEGSHSMSMGGANVGDLSLLEALVIVTQNERLSPDVLRYPQDLVNGALAAMAQQRQIVELAAERHQERLRRKLNGISADDDDDETDFSLPGGETDVLPLVMGASLQLPIQPHDILRLEMTRMEFLVSELLRVRLQKIQQLCHRIHYHREQYRMLLSPKEEVMAEKFCALYENAVSQSALHSVTAANAAQRGTTVEAAARQYFVPNPADFPSGSLSGPDATTAATSVNTHNPLPVPDKRARVFVCALEDMGQVEVGPGVTTGVNEGDTLLAPLDVFEQSINQRKARLL